MPFTIAGQPDFADPSQRPGAGFDMVTPEFFKTYSIPVLRAGYSRPGHRGFGPRGDGQQKIRRQVLCRKGSAAATDQC